MKNPREVKDLVQLAKKTAVITGATGFIGFHLASRMVSDGWDVHAIVRPQSKTLPLLTLGNNITVHRHYGTTAEMIDIMREAKPDIVFHLASLFLAQHHSKDVTPMIQSNLAFPAQLVEAMINNGVFRLVNTGSFTQHYENKDYSPVSLYDSTKQAFEAILAYYVESTPLQVITLKLFDTYGPNDTRPKLFSLLQRASLEQKPLAMSPGEQLLDLVYIDDVVNAFWVAAKRLLENATTHPMEEYAVGTKTLLTLKEIVAMYQKVSGQSFTVDWGALPYRSRQVMQPWSKGRNLPGWRPEIQLEEGIHKMLGLG